MTEEVEESRDEGGEREKLEETEDTPGDPGQNVTKEGEHYENYVCDGKGCS